MLFEKVSPANDAPAGAPDEIPAGPPADLP